jgi:hypothetical protein
MNWQDGWKSLRTAFPALILPGLPVSFQEAYESLILLRRFTGNNREKNASIRFYQAKLQLECQGGRMGLNVRIPINLMI